MGASLLDVNALVALVWDSHVHHAAVRSWFSSNGSQGWATCSITENGFVRISSNLRVLPHPISVEAARQVLSALRAVDAHQFLTDDVSITDDDVPRISGHRQITDAHLIALARRRGLRLVTFDAALLKLAHNDDVELLTI